jgi:hypothetical protein
MLTTQHGGDRKAEFLWIRWRRTDNAVSYEDTDFVFRAALDWKPVKLITDGQRDM